MRSNVSKMRAAIVPAMMLLIGALATATFASTGHNGTEPAVNNRTEVQEAEQLLANLGYLVSNTDGKLDFMSRHAVMAFQKVENMQRTGVLTASVLERLRNASAPAAKFGGPAHVEVDITRQVLFMVDDNGRVRLIVPVSTGSGERYYDKTKKKWEVAYTPRGEFKFERKINGVRKAPLGSIYYPSYFKEGWAVHGSPSIPAKPASHGCVRVPRGTDEILFSMMPIGMSIYLYD